MELMPTLIKGTTYARYLRLQEELEAVALQHNKIEIFLDALPSKKQVENYLTSVLRPIIAKHKDILFIIRIDDKDLNIKYAPIIKSVLKRNYIIYEERTDFIIKKYPSKNKISKGIISKRNIERNDS